jgi:hypothetical protein
VHITPSIVRWATVRIRNHIPAIGGFLGESADWTAQPELKWAAAPALGAEQGPRGQAVAVKVVPLASGGKLKSGKVGTGQV